MLTNHVSSTALISGNKLFKLKRKKFCFDIYSNIGKILGFWRRETAISADFFRQIMGR